jgi:ABC-2 type transport system permease protein
VLGTALGGVFGSSFSLQVRALYVVRTESPLASGFGEFMDKTRALGVRFAPAESVEQGIAGVRDADDTCLVVVSETGITLYRNDRFGIEAGFMQSLLTGFLQRYNAAGAVASVDPNAVKAFLAAPTGPYVEEASLGGNRRPRAVDYYAVTMLTMIILQGSMLGMSGMRKERKLGTARRILSGPVRRWEFLSGKVAGGLLVMVVQALVVLVLSRYAIGAYWGRDLATVFLVLVSEMVMSVSIGAGVAYLLRSEGAAMGILNTVIPVLVLFARGYGPLGSGPVFERIASLDPLGWVNRAVFGVIYTGDHSTVVPAVLICLGVAAVFFAAIGFASRKGIA